MKIRRLAISSLARHNSTYNKAVESLVKNIFTTSGLGSVEYIQSLPLVTDASVTLKTALADRSPELLLAQLDTDSASTVQLLKNEPETPKLGVSEATLLHALTESRFEVLVLRGEMGSG